MGTLEGLDVAHLEQAVGLAGGALGDVEDHERTHEPLEGDPVGRGFALGEVDRRVEVRAAVLGSAERVGRIEVTAGR